MRYPLRLIIIFVIGILFCFFSFIGEPERDHFFYGKIEGGRNANQIVEHHIITLSNNDNTKFADWVAYKLNIQSISGESVTERKWKRDPQLEASQTLEPRDYTGAYKYLDTDRGHQAPLASFKGTKYWYETNYLSNITPQKSNLNRGSWLRLENAVRDYIKATRDPLYVITGPVYERYIGELPQCKKSHVIPSGYWKIVTTNTKSGIKIAAFFFNQDIKRGSPISNHLTTVDSLEIRTKLDFFPKMPTAIQDSLEAIYEAGWFLNAITKKK